MDQLLVNGGARVQGEVRVSGAKNSVLKLMAAALLAEGTTRLTNCPDIVDVPMMADVLRGLGCEVSIVAASADGADTGKTVTIATPADLAYRADFPAVSRLRASVCVLGPLMGRLRRAVVALPGGDAIGSRPLNMHQSGLQALGAHTEIRHGAVVGEATDLRGARIELDFPSVGATENILMAAVLATGTTVIDNAAREPEIIDLADMLGQMGAQISGAGSPTIVIDGVDALSPAAHRTVGDRVVGGTWAFAAAATQGDVRVRGVNPDHLVVPLERLSAAGADIARDDDGFTVRMAGRPRAVDFVTLPYPSFPTDLQPMALTLAAVAEGHSIITENVFDARFRFVEELLRMGADAEVDCHHVAIRGRAQLSSAPVWASDIRAGAGLVLAGLVADGTTAVHDVFHIDRGYPNFVENFTALGADIRRVPDNAA